jgi:hypothetical protein
MKKQLFFVIAVLLLGSIACGGGTSGFVGGSHRSCEFNGGIVTCTGLVYKLIDSHDMKIDANYFRKGESVIVEGTIAVEIGRVKITLTGSDGTVTTANAAPDSPATFESLVTVESFIDDIYIPITFEALDEEASGLSYLITIQEP